MKKGFTLIELLAVIAILAILVVIAIPNIMKMYSNAKISSFVNQAQSIYKAINNQIMVNELENNVITNFCYAKEESNNPIQLKGSKNVYYLVETSNNKIVKLTISTEEYSVILENVQGLDITDINKNEVKTKGDSNYTLLGNCVVVALPENYVWATDADFSGTTNGEFYYIGTAEYVAIPHVIKGISVTSYSNMFNGTSVKGVYSDNTNVTIMNSMFMENYATSLDLSNLDTSNVTNMTMMLEESQATILNLSGFDTSNVTSMAMMFQGNKATILDLSSFDTSKASTMDMFNYCNATTGYARTQTDANKLNASINKPAGLTFIVKP